MSAIEVEGLEESQRKISNFIINLPNQSFAAMQDAAEQIVNAAKGFAPVDTGYLRDHIRIVEENKSAQYIIIESEAYYSGFVEFGTIRMKARPFMQPAIHEVAQTLAAKIANKIGEKLK